MLLQLTGKKNDKLIGHQYDSQITQYNLAISLIFPESCSNEICRQTFPLLLQRGETGVVTILLDINFHRLNTKFTCGALPHAPFLQPSYYIVSGPRHCPSPSPGSCNASTNSWILWLSAALGLWGSGAGGGHGRTPRQGTTRPGKGSWSELPASPPTQNGHRTHGLGPREPQLPQGLTKELS